MSEKPTYQISYGKLNIPLYRVYARPLHGVAAIPESAFHERANVLVAMEVDVEVLGDNFLPAYTHGDNSSVVATDSMKNIVLEHALDYDGATLEGFLDELGRLFLNMYPAMRALRLRARELPFSAARVPGASAGSFEDSDVLFSRSRDDWSLATLECTGRGAEYRVTGHRCGRLGLQLIKVTGSAFTRFVRDEHTTLPERVDRPLFTYVDVYWTYADVQDMLAPDPVRYVPAEQVRDVVLSVFHQFVSESIQHLVHEMGTRLLARFPHLAGVSFEAQNHTWDPAFVSERDPRVKVYVNPFPAYGIIKLTMTRGADEEWAG
jgi:urate oxidase